MAPRRNLLFTFNPRTRLFEKEHLRLAQQNMIVPANFKSVLMPSGDIYLLGGLYADQALKSCCQIDSQAIIRDRSPMNFARHSLAAAMVRDRFILAIGGFNSKFEPNGKVEIHDTFTNSWLPANSLPKPIANVCAVVIL